MNSMHLKRVYVFFLKIALHIMESLHPGCMSFVINLESSVKSLAAAASYPKQDLFQHSCKIKICILFLRFMCSVKLMQDSTRKAEQFY